MTARAQREGPTPQQATAANVQAWLQSKDPRMVAWGATFARESSDSATMELVVKQIERTMSRDGLDPSSGRGPAHDAIAALLDAAIQRNAEISVDTLGLLKDGFPSQIAILMARASPEKSQSYLMWWYRSDNSALAKIAAMLLSKAPPTVFAASILASSEEHLSVTVVSPTDHSISGFFGASGGTCGDSMSVAPEPGWPDRVFYVLEEHDNSSGGPTVVEAGGDRITWQRQPETHGRGSCFYVQPLSAGDRHRLLSEMLGVPDDGLGWPLEEHVRIAWEGEEKFHAALGGAVARENAKLRQTVQEFVARRLISAEQARSSMPRLAVSIDYHEGYSIPAVSSPSMP